MSKKINIDLDKLLNDKAAMEKYIHGLVKKSSKSNAMFKRSVVLYFSLELELTLSTLLCTLLKIDIDKSKSFGDSREALGFNQKVTLLLDLDAFDSTDKETLRVFMELRNKFMHVKQIDTYESVINRTKKLKFLKDKYPDLFKNGESEKVFEKVIIQFGLDCSKILTKGFDKLITEDVNKQVEDIQRAIHKAYADAVNKLATDFSKENPHILDYNEIQKLIQIDMKKYVDSAANGFFAKAKIK